MTTFLSRLRRRHSEATPGALRYQPKRARLFVKPYCGWCRQAMDWLDDHRIAYDTLNVIADAGAYDEMVRLSGQSLAPVIDVDGTVLADFSARELEAFWETLGGGKDA